MVVGEPTPEAVAKLLKEAVAELPGASPEVDSNFTVDEACCARYLRARGLDHGAAKKMLQATIAWRKEFGISRLVDEHFPVIAKEAETGKTVVLPFHDSDGRPIMLLRPRNENNFGGHEGNIMHLVYQLERAVAAAAACSKEKWSLIIDFGGYSMSNAPSMQTTQTTLAILQDHYPERLFRAYLVDAPWLFKGVFRAISPFIDTVTRAKLAFVSSKGGDDGLTAHLPAASVEKCLGGSADYVYLSTEYLAEDRAKWEAKQSVMDA